MDAPRTRGVLLGKCIDAPQIALAYCTLLQWEHTRSDKSFNACTGTPLLHQCLMHDMPWKGLSCVCSGYLLACAADTWQADCMLM